MLRKLLLITTLLVFCGKFYAQTSEYQVNLVTSLGDSVTTGTVESCPYGSTYPSGAVAWTHLGNGVWRGIMSYGEWALYYNGVAISKYKRFFVGENRIKSILDKVVLGVSGSDTTLTVWGNWNFKGSSTFKNNVYNGINNFNGIFRVPSDSTASIAGFEGLTRRELRFLLGDSLLAYYDNKKHNNKTIASREWADTHFVKLSEANLFGKADSTILIGVEQRELGNMELAWNYNALYPELILNFAGTPYGNRVDTFWCAPKIRSLGYYLNPNHFTVSGDSISLKLGSGDSSITNAFINNIFSSGDLTLSPHAAGVDAIILDGISDHYTDELTPSSGGTLDPATDQIFLNPSANISYDAITSSEFNRRILILNESATYTVTFTKSSTLIVPGSSVVLGQDDCILFIYNAVSGKWIRCGGSDN